MDGKIEHIWVPYFAGLHSPLKLEATAPPPQLGVAAQPRMNVLEALASWQLLSVREMATRLQGMSLADRTQLRQRYADEHP